MPSQIPPTSPISGEVSFIITMSTPGSMPSSRTPRTLPVNTDGVVPLVTVRPWRGPPARSPAPGVAVPQEPVAATDGDETAARPVRQSPAVAAAVASIVARDVGFFMGVPPLSACPVAGAVAPTDARGRRLVAWLPGRGPRGVLSVEP